jgi:hypothetical protein
VIDVTRRADNDRFHAERVPSLRSGFRQRPAPLMSAKRLNLDVTCGADDDGLHRSDHNRGAGT